VNRYIAFCINFPKSAIAILSLITVLLAPGILRLKIDNSIETLMPKHDSQYLFYNEVKEIYGDNGQFIVMAVSAGDLFGHDTMTTLDHMITDLEEYKDFNREKETARLNRFAEFQARGSVSAAELIDHFKNDLPFQRLIERKINALYGGKSALTSWNLRKLQKAVESTYALKEIEIIEELISPFTAQDIKGADDALEIYDLIPEDDGGNRLIPETADEIRAFETRLTRNPAFEDILYARDKISGDISDFGILIKFKTDELHRDAATRDIIRIISSYKDYDTVFTGMPVVYTRVVDYIHMDFTTLVSLVMLAVMLIFYLNFRSFRGVWLPVLSLIMAETWVLGLMGYLGFRITVMASSLPTLMIAVGSSYAIHILNQYYNDFDLISERGKKEGLFLSMTHISLTVLLTGLTTFIAFVTLGTSQLSAIREWGIFSGLGALFAVFISSALIPAALMLLPHKIPNSLRSQRKKPILLA